jgi:hypothetical protein
MTSSVLYQNSLLQAFEDQPNPERVVLVVCGATISGVVEESK